MSDVRTLLRQQREARRIDHQYAAYSDAGKLLCTICREQVKTEALWDSHLQSDSHRQKVRHLHSTAPTLSKDLDNANEIQEHSNGRQGSNAVGRDADAAPAPGMASHPKRKHSRDEDGDEAMDESIRKKRSRPDIADGATRGDAEKETRQQRSNSETLTPPSLARRTSTTPSQGVELQIPSRPATPSHRDGSSASAPGTGISASVGSEKQSTRPSKGLPSAATDALVKEAGLEKPATQVDESEWAAFEADIAAASVPYAEDATISAPAMTADESAAATQAATMDQANDKRKAKVDVDLEDEREEATRALEEEFEEMEELEARVQRLRQKREDIRRKRSESQGQATAAAPAILNGIAEETLEQPIPEVAAAEPEEDDEDDDDEDDDWDSFRFRGR